MAGLGIHEEGVAHLIAFILEHCVLCSDQSTLVLMSSMMFAVCCFSCWGLGCFDVWVSLVEFGCIVLLQGCRKSDAQDFHQDAIFITYSCLELACMCWANLAGVLASLAARQGCLLLLVGSIEYHVEEQNRQVFVVIFQLTVVVWQESTA